MVLEIIIIKLSCILKMMSRNTFPEPQPDSALYQLSAGIHSDKAGTKFPHELTLYYVWP